MIFDEKTQRPVFEGTDQDYDIATRGTPLSNAIDDGGDGFTLVEHGGEYFKVRYYAGRPYKVEPFGPVINQFTREK